MPFPRHHLHIPLTTIPARRHAAKTPRRAFGAAVALGLAWPMGAMALTADDLLAAQNNLVARLGFTPMGQINRTDDAITMEDAGGRMVLPFDWGEIGWHFSPLILHEDDDAVTVTWDGELDLTLDYRPHHGGAKPGMDDPRFTTVFTMTASDYISRATGTPDAITLTNSAAALDIRLTAADWWQAVIMGLPRPAGPDKTQASAPQIALSLQDWTSTQTLTGFTAENTGTAVYDSRDSVALLAAQTTFIGPMGSDNMASAQEDLDTALSLTLPAAPLSVGTFSEALRQGFAFSTENAMVASHGDNTTRYEGGDSRVTHSTGAGTSRLALDATSGLILTSTGEDIQLTVNDTTFGQDPWSTSIDSIGFDLALPVMANGLREQALLAVDIGGLRSDTGVILGRNLPDAFANEPFSFGLTLGTDYEPLQDLVDIGSLIDVLETQDILRVYDFGVDRLELRYGDASLTGGGRFGWGLYGAILNDALPNPKGRAVFTLTGVYGLLNTLGQAQLVPQDVLTAARGAVAAFGQAKGPDVVESTIVLGPDGFTINGVPAPF